MHDVPSTRPEGDVGDSTAFSKEEQIPRLVAFSIRGDRDLFSLAELLVAVARQPNAACRVHRLREPRAIDAPLGAATPEIGRAGKPLERELGQREVSRFHAYLLFPAYEAGGHRSFLSIREFHHAAGQLHLLDVSRFAGQPPQRSASVATRGPPRHTFWKQ